MNFNAAGLYSVAQDERAAASRRAAEVRRKLVKSASSIEGDSIPEETLLIGHWLNSRQDGRHSQVLDGDQYRSAASGKDPDFG
jgi:hypothetical protein